MTRSVQEDNIELVGRTPIMGGPPAGLDDLAALVAEDFANHGRVVGPRGIRTVWEDLATMWGDRLSRPIEIAAAGENVVLRLFIRQRHIGQPRLPIDGGYLCTAAPTGKISATQHIHWWKVRDGKLAEHWACRDDVSMMVQLGLWTPPPHFAGPLAEPAAPVRVQVQGEQTEEQTRNLAAVMGFFGRLNEGDVAGCLEFLTEDAINHGPFRGKAAFKAVLGDIAATFPDFHRDLSDIEIIAVGDSVIARDRCTGTHKGTARLPIMGGFLEGRAPTGKRFETRHIHWFHLRDGLIAAHYANRDDLTLMIQLGLVEPPAPSAFMMQMQASPVG